MTTMTPQLQRTADLRFAYIMKQEFGPKRTLKISPQLQAMMADPRATIHTFSLFQQIISNDTVLQHRNELARAFANVLKNNDWTRQQSLDAVPTMNWLLSLKTGKNIGGYLRVIRPMVDLACTKLNVPLAQKKAWKTVVAEKPVSCPKDLGKQAADVFPRPALRGLFTR